MIRTLIDKQGRISTPDMMSFYDEFSHHKGHEVNIEIKRVKRTSQQNKTLHWGLGLFAKGLLEKGYKIKMEDLKYELKEKGFFGWVEYETKDGVKKRPKDTHELSTDECAQAFQDIQMAASHYDIFIPDPDPEKAT